MNSSHKSTCFAFNGDADGLISQHLAELSGIRPDRKITGLKRKILLLDQILPENGLDLYVFDISLEINRTDLLRLLDTSDAKVTWYDHHEPGELPTSPRLKTRIVNVRGTCTALLAHADFPGADPRWAAMAAFGDNLPEAAEALLRPLAVGAEELALLREAGERINYNAYGETEDDVLFSAATVADRMAAFRDPLEFVRASGLIEPLGKQLREDEEKMRGLRPRDERAGGSLYALPAEAWARRLGPTFANRAALANPEKAIAILQPLSDGAYQVSIRSPRGRKDAPPASDLAREFPTGGGRALAAGINRLPAKDIEAFSKRFFEYYP